MTEPDKKFRERSNSVEQIELPKKPYTIYKFLEKCQDKTFEGNPFVDYRLYHNVQIKIARNVSIYNIYQVDIPFSKKIKADFVIKYLKNIEYRNAFSPPNYSIKLINQITQDNWIEEEVYNQSKNKFNCNMFNFKIIFYKNDEDFNQNTSQVKYYQSYKILNDDNNYIIRLEMVLNINDLDQDQDINVQVLMIINLLRSVYKTNKLEFELDNITK